MMVILTQLVPIIVTLVGIATDVSPVHPSKADEPKRMVGLLSAFITNTVIMMILMIMMIVIVTT